MNVVAATDLLYPGQQDPIGLNSGGNWSRASLLLYGIDRQRYVVWVDAGRPHRRELEGQAVSRPELAPRLGLHLVACRNGAGS